MKTKRKKVAPATLPPGLPRRGACHFCGNPSNIVRALWYKGGDASRCKVTTVWPWCEETHVFVCLACDRGGGPIHLVAKVTWERQPPEGGGP